MWGREGPNYSKCGTAPHLSLRYAEGYNQIWFGNGCTAVIHVEQTASHSWLVIIVVPLHVHFPSFVLVATDTKIFEEGI